MSDIRTKNGFRYSYKPFDGYKYRAKFVAEDEGGTQIFNRDIYTDNEDRREVAQILSLKAEKEFNWVINTPLTGLINWASKEQDEHTNKFLDDILKDI